MRLGARACSADCHRLNRRTLVTFLLIPETRNSPAVADGAMVAKAR